MLESSPRSAEAVRRAAVVPHGKAERLGDALARLERVAADAGVELVDADGEPDVAIVLGGDGTMLRALHAFLGTDVPVFGVNFGRVGFLTSVDESQLEDAAARVFAGEYRVAELATLRADVGGRSYPAINDAVATSGRLGRIIELGWDIGGEDLGAHRCDGVICASPSGSTAYNLSNGGPVLMWGLEAIALTYVAAHSLHARPLVIPPGSDVIVWNRSADVEAGVLVDGHEVSRLGKAERAVVRIANERSLLATLPEATFVRRYRQSFAS